MTPSIEYVERSELIAVYARLALSELRANQLEVQIKSQSRITANALEQLEKLRDPAILHVNLLRGLPARLSKEQLIHLLGNEAHTSEAKP